MVRGIRKRVIGLSLLGVMVLSNVITPLMAFGLDYSNQLGTNVALGSPLLNEDFNYSITENGALGYRTTGKELLDMNFAISSMRKMSTIIFKRPVCPM